MHYKFTENGWEPVSFRSLPNVKFWNAVEKFSQKWLKAVLVALILILAFALYNAFKPASYSMEDMQNYAVVYANKITH